MLLSVQLISIESLCGVLFNFTWDNTLSSSALLCGRHKTSLYFFLIFALKHRFKFLSRFFFLIFALKHRFKFLSRIATPVNPIQCTAIFHGCENDNFQMKKVDNFLIFALKHRSWYTLEPTKSPMQIHRSPVHPCKTSVLDKWKHEFVCLFVLMLYVPVNSYGHAGTSLPISWDFYPALRWNDTSSPAQKHHPSKQLRLLWRGGLTLSHTTHPGQA